MVEQPKDGGPKDVDPRQDDTAIRPSPGASGPGEMGYDGDVALGDEGAAAGPEAYQDPFGRPDGGVKP